MTHRGPFQHLSFCDSVILCGCSSLPGLGSWLSQGSLTGQLPLAQSWALLVGWLSWFNRSMKWDCRKTSPSCVSAYVYPQHQLQWCAISCNFKEPPLASECVMMVSTSWFSFTLLANNSVFLLLMIPFSNYDSILKSFFTVILLKKNPD